MACRFFCVLIFPSFSRAELFGQPSTHNDSLFTPSLGRTKSFIALLPSGYDVTKRYPVLYLLHGLTGNYSNWISRTNLQKYAKPYALIIIMPDGENSWYVNSYTEARDRFEDYLIRDLPAYVEKKYSIDTTHRSIAGLSMGGYGALMLALRYPRRFFFAGGLSSAITVPRDIEAREKVGPLSMTIQGLKRVFGDNPNPFRSSHDVFRLYKNVSPDSLPYMYLAVGIQDHYLSFLPAHREFTDSLRAYGAAYEYHELPGKHNWEFWDREIQPLLKRLQEVLYDESPSRRSIPK